MDDIAAVVLAGGQGKRLYPLSLNHCKPAVPFGGRYRLIDIPISNALNSNIRRIFVLAQYLTAELQHHLSQTYFFDVYNPGSLDFLTPEEKADGEKKWFEGTADAIRQTLPFLLEAPVDYYLILSGDQLYNINFTEMLHFAKKTGADLTIASLPVAEEEAKRMGLLQIDENANILKFHEKPENKALLDPFLLPSSFFKKWGLKEKNCPQYLGSMGIYIFKRESLIKLLREDQREDFGKHLIPAEMQKGRTAAYIYHGYWEDIGTISSFYEANLALTENKCCLDMYDERCPIFAKPTHLPGPKIHGAQISHSLLSEGAMIDAQEISHSIIGLRCKIGAKTIIRNSIIMGSHFYTPPLHQAHLLPKTFGIGKNCLLEKAVIDEHVLIGNNVKLTNEKHLQSFDGQGVFIRDGIIVVTAGTEIPDGYIL